LRITLHKSNETWCNDSVQRRSPAIGAQRVARACAPGQSGSGAAVDAGTALCAVFITIARKV
jgi:hypothetical protein